MFRGLKIKQIQSKVRDTLIFAHAQFFNKFSRLAYINLALIFAQFLYIKLRFAYINSDIPMWYNRAWGEAQLAPKGYIYFLPVAALIILVMGMLLLSLNKFFIRYFNEVVYYAILFCNTLIMIALFKIISISSIPFKPLINPDYLNLLIPMGIAFTLVYLLMPGFIEYAYRHKLVTNPSFHTHPGMILQKPSARGGGFIFAMVFIVLAMLYVGISSRFNVLFISILLVTLLGIIDDYQNTHPSSKARLLENPVLRLILLFLCVLPIVFGGFRIEYIGNLSGGIIRFDYWISVAITAIWIVWVLNLLSWSNGIDGQYGGIIGIVCIFIAMLALRFDKLTSDQVVVAVLGAIAAGAAFGFTKYTWHPSKIMWGFSAMTAGLVVSVLSISIQSKIVTSVLLIMIPFLDAVVTVFRRIIQRKNPFAGDRGHLHHHLLAKGWSVQKIAIFYWVSTFVMGLIGMLSSERYIIQIVLTLSGIVAFPIIILNLRSLAKKPEVQ